MLQFNEPSEPHFSSNEEETTCPHDTQQFGRLSITDRFGPHTIVRRSTDPANDWDGWDWPLPEGTTEEGKALLLYKCDSCLGCFTHEYVFAGHYRNIPYTG